MLASRTLRGLREARVGLGLSQATVASELGCTQAALAKVEAGKVPVTVERVAELASILGMEIGLNLHPIGDPIRDKGQQALIRRLRAILAPAWRVSHEAVLSISGDGRAWDLLLTVARHSVGVECETRIRDIQAIVRRTHLRERDGGTDRILIVPTARRTVGWPTNCASRLASATRPRRARSWPPSGRACRYPVPA